MAEPILKLESDGDVRIITLNNPDMLNAMVDELHEALTDVWTTLMRDQTARAVVITGAGRAFSAGGDIPGFIKTVEDEPYRRSNMRTARALVDNILGCHLPVIAAVNGPAVGLGCSVAASSDIVFMSDKSFFADTHVNVGLVAGDGGVVTWPFFMSILKAKEYLFTGERISPEKALELGMANRVVPHDDLMKEAVAFAQLLATKPPQALQETKRSINLHLQQASLLVLPFALSTESESFASSPEVKTAIENFKSKAKQP